MRRSISIILAVVMLLSVICIAPASANAITSGNFGYRLTKSGNAVIFNYYGNKTDVVFPATLDGHKVTAIDTGVNFNDDYTNFGKVTISKGIKKICGGAFENCKIDTLVLPSTVTTIENYAFCVNDFESVKLPEKALNLGVEVFASCYSLKKVTLPSKLTKIPKSFFSGCKKLKEIKLPSKVKTIGEAAFLGCKKLSKVTFNSKLTKIGKRAFESCEALTSVKLNEGLKTICEDAFTECYTLKKVYLPYTLKTIEKFAFFFDSALETVTIPDSVKTVGDYAFGYFNEVFGDDDLMYFKYQDEGGNPFVIKAYKNTAGAKYAKDNEFTYKEIKAPKKVKVNKKTAKLTVGKTLKLKATFKPKKAVTLLKWKSSNKKIATVTQKGKVKAKKRGNVTITVKTHNGKKANCKIKVV